MFCAYIVVSFSALPFGVTTETLATHDAEVEEQEKDTPMFEKYDAMLHGPRKERKYEFFVHLSR